MGASETDARPGSAELESMNARRTGGGLWLAIQTQRRVLVRSATDYANSSHALLPRRAKVTSATSANRSECARRPAAMRRRDPRPRGGFSLPHLRGGEGVFRQPRIAEPELDFDHAIAADARAHSQRQAAENELEMRDLQSLRRHDDLAVGSETCLLQTEPMASRASAVGTMRMGA